METTLNIAIGLLLNNSVSKVKGRRNWVVKTKDNKVALMPYGEALRQGSLRASFKAIAEHNLNWFYFTYKKDALECLQSCIKAGYNEVNVIY